ncbi:IS630 family transposase [Microvirga sp. KLBC 81]|uniref:IS630 family transposase n=1 Tax=Microvirga sp. KLBC 81 TaxID=1862707 RepID=UPI000D51F2B5|nr:IS630 family transposase [Microvirga sp. KLBC 81]PVE21513.1 IS630 family transposase [Microvirga sp. KLBC 81]
MRRRAWRGFSRTPLARQAQALTAAVIQRVVDMTLHEKPPRATQWSVRSMAAVTGLSHTSVQRIWHAHSLKPHLIKTFKLSTDTYFVETVQDVVGLYLDPPDKALVLAVDEKSQIQALDSTQPGLSLKKGRAGTHDPRRSTAWHHALLAALDGATGTVLGTCMKRHRHQEFLRLLREIDRVADKRLDLHLIVDNDATHKHPKKASLERHPRFAVSERRTETAYSAPRLRPTFQSGAKSSVNKRSHWL